MSHRKSITGPAEPSGRLTHLSGLVADVEAIRDDSVKAKADLQQRIEGKHRDIEKRNTDAARENEQDSLAIVAMSAEVDDLTRTESAANAAIQAAKESLR